MTEPVSTPTSTSDDADNIALSTDPLHGQPLAVVERDGVRYTLLGTAHVSQQSVDAVNALLDPANRRFDAVAVELCEGRFQALSNPQDLQQMDLLRIIREEKIPMVAANLALSGYQRRLAEQLGVEPGAEQKAAIAGADALGLPVWRIDREVGLTLRRCYASVSWWRKFGIIGGLLGSLFDDEDIEQDEIERLKQGDMLESSFGDFARSSPALYEALIGERDRFMAARLREESARSGSPAPREVLVVIGAGHMAGTRDALERGEADPAEAVASLSTAPPKGQWGRIFGWLLIATILGLFAVGFWKGSAIGTELLLNWVGITALGGALGCLAAGGHPLSILAAAVASPITPLSPALASGTISALVEAWVRRPTVADFSALRDDLYTFGGWWRNHVLRVFLNFFLTSLGTALAVYLAGWKMIQALG
ncbi:MAG: TraB/GumN family protein [Lysobacteraceae bacterium]